MRYGRFKQLNFNYMDIKLNESKGLSKEDVSSNDLQSAKEKVAETVTELKENAKDVIDKVQTSELYMRGVSGLQGVLGLSKMGLSYLSTKLEKYQDQLKEKKVTQ